MNDLYYLARSRATIIWMVLVGATLASWWFGAHNDIPGLGHAPGRVGAVVMTIAMVKVRFVTQYFMELRDAPPPLRWIVDGYIAIVLAMVVTLLLAN